MNTGNRPVVFYGAGNYACLMFDKLSAMYSPVAFCDSSELKHGSVVMGLPVYSLDESLNRYPECLFYVTPTVAHKFDIFNFLIQRGIQPEQIINYEKARRYKSCAFLEAHVIYSDSFFSFCCSDFGRNKSPTGATGKSNEETLSNILSTRDRLIEDLGKPNFSLSGHPCAGCYEVKERYWGENRHIRQFALDFECLCNIKCMYCEAEKRINLKSKDEMVQSAEKALSFFKYMENSSQITPNTIIIMAAGEISVHPLREKVLETIEGYSVWFSTNACVYNDKIAKILKNSGSKIVASVDAGTRETFAKIKGVDAFDKVCANLKRYSEHGFVDLKYIFLPGVNDNEDDVNGFFDLCKKIQAQCVVISRDFREMHAFQEHTIQIIAKLVNMLQKASISVSAADVIFHGSDNSRQLNEKVIEIKNKEIHA